MKNLLFLFIISIIISIIAACKDDVIYINNPDTISLNVTTNKFITKGIPINSATDSLFTSFGIFAYQTDNDFDLSDIPSQYYSVFSNKTANRNSSNNWLFDITYYWPQYGQLTFFAYAPYTSDTAYGMKIHENPGGIPYIRYNVPLDPAQQPDIMVAVTQENLSRVEVPVDFKHALSCIGFNVTADTLKVDSIWISGVSLSGSLYLNYTDSVIWSDLGEVSKDTCIAGLTDNCIAYESGSQIMASDGYLMMIPQTLSDSACLNIQFDNIETKTVYF